MVVMVVMMIEIVIAVVMIVMVTMVVTLVPFPHNYHQKMPIAPVIVVMGKIRTLWLAIEQQ